MIAPEVAMRFILLLSLLCAACSSGLANNPDDQSVAPLDLATAASDGAPRDLATAAGADLSARDLATPPMDLARIVDLAGGGGNQGGNAQIACGNVTCKAPTSVCCRANPFGQGACVAPGAGCGNGQPFFCDDPSDCNPGQICCYTANGSTCTTAADCAAKMGREMCQQKTDCAPNLMCCGAGPSPSYYCGAMCPISRRRYKTNIEYLDASATRRLHDELLRYRLGTWQYRADGPAAPSHLGFIIDDVVPSPSVDASGERVDLYGYTSMTVAAVQEQARQIAELKKAVEDLKRELRKRR